MMQISEQSIWAEAERIFESRGRPIWSHPLDYWREAVANLSSAGEHPEGSPALLHGLASTTPGTETKFADNDAGRL